MYTESCYKELLKLCPDTISKEQLYKLCHISKRAAKYYLDLGIIRCTNNGKATHRYTIRTKDAIAFMKNRDADPELFRLSNLRRVYGEHSSVRTIVYDEETLLLYRKLLEEICAPYPDLLTMKNVSKLTGYTEKTVGTWTARGLITWFRNDKTYFIPKEYLIDFMMSTHFRSIAHKSSEHLKIQRKLRQYCKGIKKAIV